MDLVATSEVEADPDLSRVIVYSQVEASPIDWGLVCLVAEWAGDKQWQTELHSSNNSVPGHVHEAAFA